MERVHFYQEQMLPELKEFEEKGIFSQTETRAILKQRTAFESALIRRVALKSDYIKYVQYEITLESLRKKRVQRINVTQTKTSLSDYCIIRRQYYILERAVRKFKNDVPLWIHYIELAKSNNARGLVGKLCSRALSLHPTSPSLYIIAASHELDSTLSPVGARTLLQRGLRINPESALLWTEYVRMELGYCEGLRRRWDTLGLDKPGQDEDSDARETVLSGGIVRAVITSATQSLHTLELLGSLQTLLQSYPTQLRPQLVEHLHSEFASREAGLDHAAEDSRCGAVLLRATTELPSRSLERGVQLQNVPPLRPLIAAAFPNETAPFASGEQTVDFVHHIRKASETLSAAGKTDVRVAELYARWVAAWVPVVADQSLSLYLVLALTTTANSLAKTRAEKHLWQSLTTVFRITLSLNKTTSPDETQYRKLAKRYAKICAHDAALWIMRLDAESGANRPMDLELATYSPSNDLPDLVQKLWAESRASALETAGEENLLVDLWTWGMRHMSWPKDPQRRQEAWKVVLRESLSHTSLTLHSMLLLRRLFEEDLLPAARVTLVKKLIGQYRPAVCFFDRAMDQELKRLLANTFIPAPGEQKGPPRKKKKRDDGTQILVEEHETSVLATLYTAWRIIPDQSVPAVLKWATSLWELGQRKRAKDAVLAAGGSKLAVEWEKLRDETSEDKLEDITASIQPDDIGLESVEFI